MPGWVSWGVGSVNLLIGIWLVVHGVRWGYRIEWCWGLLTLALATVNLGLAAVAR